jgi:hypothetical protein
MSPQADQHHEGSLAWVLGLLLASLTSVAGKYLDFVALVVIHTGSAYLVLRHVWHTLRGPHRKRRKRPSLIVRVWRAI